MRRHGGALRLRRRRSQDTARLGEGLAIGLAAYVAHPFLRRARFLLLLFANYESPGTLRGYRAIGSGVGNVLSEAQYVADLDIRLEGRIQQHARKG